MGEVFPRGYAPLDATSLYTLIHGSPPCFLPAAAPAFSGHSGVDAFEAPSSPLAPSRPPPDVSVDLENLHAWCAMADKARTLDPVAERRETRCSQAHAAHVTFDALQEERDTLRTELRYHLNHPRRFLGRILKIRSRVKALRVNLRASGWPTNYLPLHQSQYESHESDVWLEQLRAWDQAILHTAAD